MNYLLQALKISNFEAPLKVLSELVNTDSAIFIDGGAGSGTTAKQMASHLGKNGLVYAFEPFPGNHQFFETITDPRIRLVKHAISDQDCESALFQVSSVVDNNRTDAWKNKAGYSSVGRLCEGEKAINPHDVMVKTVRTDDFISEHDRVAFIKLDLQGGEFKALKGMSSILNHAKMMWIEYSGQNGLLDLITGNNYIVFDSEYFFIDPPADSNNYFNAPRRKVLSTGKEAFFCYRSKDWNSFQEEFLKLKNDHRYVQTDLLCVKREIMPDFMRLMLN
jgi:FkbM family methyltransferase